jgi:membrane-associated phospholipid phosphatase
MAHAAKFWPKKEPNPIRVAPHSNAPSWWPGILRAVIVLAVSWVALEVLSLVLGLTVVGRHGGGPIQSWDNTVEQWSIGHRAHFVSVSKFIAVVGDAPVLGPLCVAATVVLLLLRQRMRAFIPLVAYLGGEAIVFITREVVKRHRPPTADYPAPHAIPGVHETSYSYPSGHATAAVAVLVSLAVLAVITWPKVWGWVLAVILGPAAVLVAWSRLVLGVHWFSDVAFGMAFGVPWGVAVALVLRTVPWPSFSRNSASPRPSGRQGGTA